MTSDRPYRNGFTHARTLAIIQFNAGTQFDPEIIAVFCRLIRADEPGEAALMVGCERRYPSTAVCCPVPAPTDKRQRTTDNVVS
jgi:hypothetical protein